MNSDVPESKLKCVTVMVFEQKGRTVLQPIVTGQDMQSVRELFQRSTLEVWLPNGQTDFSQFDVEILRYRQTIQPPKMCGRVKNRVCLKNFEAIASCEQCPLSGERPQARSGRGRTPLPSLFPQLQRLGSGLT